MYCRVIACDLDGTSATDGHLAPEVAAALGAARAQGFVTLLVTGRVHEEVEALCNDLSMFDAVVAENGAVVCLPHLGRTLELGIPPPDQFLGELRTRGVHFHAGAVVVGTSDRHAVEVLELIRRFAIDGQLAFNREAMMVLPSGINKAVGVRRALEELDRSEHSLVAFGDAENDLAMFAVAERSVAARGAAPAVAIQADERLSQPGAAGVATYIHHLLEQGGIMATPPRHRVLLGQDVNGAPVGMPSSGVNVMITGDPRSGKSWLAGLLAEQLIEQGYRLCIIDPEGDHISLAQRPRVLLLGHDLTLPRPAALPRILRHEAVSVILNLASLDQQAQSAYVETVLSELEVSSAGTGIPHWIMIDEAHYFFHRHASSVRHFAGTVNFIFSTYRPSIVSNAVYAAVHAHLITHTAVDDERYFISSLLQAHGPRELIAHDALGDLEAPHAGLLLEEPSGPRWQVFTASERLTVHAHHARKYANTRLPEDRAFRFLYADNGLVVAHNVMEFHRAIQTVPMASLRHHLAHGDFSRWALGVLGNHELARGLRKLERTALAGAPPDRGELCTHVEEHYLIQAPAQGDAGNRRVDG